MHVAFRRASLVGVTLALLAAPAAGAQTYRVAGEQVPVDPEAGTFRMTGGLLGDFRLVAIHEDAGAGPLVRAHGRERFDGCVDRALDGSCDGDPAGTLRFRFRYWALPASGDAVVWGACWHPIVGGTGAFRDASGVLMMVDTPEAGGQLRTDYIGNVTTGEAKARGATASAATC